MHLACVQGDLSWKAILLWTNLGGEKLHSKIYDKIYFYYMIPILSKEIVI